MRGFPKGAIALILTALVGAGGWIWLNHQGDRTDGAGSGALNRPLWSQAAQRAQHDITEERFNDGNGNGVNGSKAFGGWEPGAHTIRLLDEDADREEATLKGGQVYVVTLACGGMRDIVIAGIGEMHMGVPLECRNGSGAQAIELHGVTSDAVGGPWLDVVFRVPEGKAADGHIGWHVGREG